MKTVINQKETGAAVLKAKKDFHEITNENGVLVLGTTATDDMKRTICVIKEDDFGYALQSVNKQGKFITQFIPTPVELLSAVVISEVKDKKVVDNQPS